MGESDCFVISIYYWIGLQQDSVPAARVCLCADLFKSIMFPHVCTVYAHRLTFSVPRLLPPLCVLLSTFVLSLALFYSVFWLSSPVFVPHLSLPSSFHPLTHPHAHLSLCLALSSSPVYQTHNRPAAPKPAESPAACAQTDGREWRWATTAADSWTDQQHDCSKCH